MKDKLKNIVIHAVFYGSWLLLVCLFLKQATD